MKPGVRRARVPADVDAYIAAAPAAVRPVLRRIRRTIRAAAPDAEELVSYRMPAYRQHGILLYFGAFERHVGLFPPVAGDARLAKALAPYAGPKGNLRFPLDRPIPYALIERIVRLRVLQDGERATRSSPRGRIARAAPAKGARAVEPGIRAYNDAQAPADRAICRLLAREIDRQLPDAERKVWHAHPVWFLDGNPIVGYSKLKGCVRLLFWSGQSFEAPGLAAEGSFKAAEARYAVAREVDVARLRRWLAEARDVQWDYKNLVRRKGRLQRLK